MVRKKRKKKAATDGSEPPLKVVKLHSRRRCPHCKSNKWERLGQDASKAKPQRYVFIRFRCQRCTKEFLAEEYGVTKHVQSAHKCRHCGSYRVEKDPRGIPDIRLYHCRQCHGSMVILEEEADNPSSESGA